MAWSSAMILPRWMFSNTVNLRVCNSKDRVCTKDLQSREYLVCTATGVHDMIWLVDKIVR